MEHRRPEGISDHIALTITMILRWFADTFFAKRYGHRAVVLETVAGVPGMVAGMWQHLRSLRQMIREQEVIVEHPQTMTITPGDIGSCRSNSSSLGVNPVRSKAAPRISKSKNGFKPCFIMTIAASAPPKRAKVCATSESAVHEDNDPS